MARPKFCTLSKLQGSQALILGCGMISSFVLYRNYKVLKPSDDEAAKALSFVLYRNYKVLKRNFCSNPVR